MLNAPRAVRASIDCDGVITGLNRSDMKSSIPWKTTVYDTERVYAVRRLLSEYAQSLRDPLSLLRFDASLEGLQL